jgi:hypothetical protein
MSGRGNRPCTPGAQVNISHPLPECKERVGFRFRTRRGKRASQGGTPFRRGGKAVGVLPSENPPGGTAGPDLRGRQDSGWQTNTCAFLTRLPVRRLSGGKTCTTFPRAVWRGTELRSIGDARWLNERHRCAPGQRGVRRRSGKSCDSHSTPRACGGHGGNKFLPALGPGSVSNS